MDDNIEVSDLIDYILKEYQIKQKYLAYLLGISVTHLCNVYNGNKKASKIILNFLRVIKLYPKTFDLLKEVKTIMPLAELDNYKRENNE